MVPLLAGNKCKAGNEEGLCSDSRFLWILHEWSKNNWSRIHNTITKGCLHCKTGSESVRRAQEREPAPVFPQRHAAASLESKVLCWPAVKHLPYGLMLTAPAVSFLQHRHPTAIRATVTSKSLHKGHRLGVAAVPCQPGACCNDLRGKSSIPKPQAPFDLVLCPMDVSIKQMIHASVNRHKCATQRSSLKLKEQNLQLRTLMTKPGFSESSLCGW